MVLIYSRMFGLEDGFNLFAQFEDERGEEILRWRAL